MTLASLFRNLIAITVLAYAYFALQESPDPRQWHWGAWAVLVFWYSALVAVYWEKNLKRRHDIKGN